MHHKRMTQFWSIYLHSKQDEMKSEYLVARDSFKKIANKKETYI